MDCLDCLLDSHRHTVAVGTCAECGAGVCIDHAVILEHRLTRLAALAREIPVEPPARLLQCPTCQAACDAQAGRPTEARHPGRRAGLDLPLVVHAHH